ncbi:MAG: hypothetical protein WEA09_02775 [Gemmatimonadota bacterium]
MSRPCAAVACGVILFTACTTPPETGEEQLEGALSHQPEGVELQLSVSPNHVAGRPDLLPALSPVWEVSGRAPLNLRAVSDVRLRPDGGLVLADYRGRQVLLLDGEGRLKGSVGREGDGPGEFRRPFTVLPVAQDLLGSRVKLPRSPS